MEGVSAAAPWRHRQPRLSAFWGSQSNQGSCPLGAASSADHPSLHLPDLRAGTEAGDQLPRIDSNQAPAVAAAALDYEEPPLRDSAQGLAAHVPLVPANHGHCAGIVW